MAGLTGQIHLVDHLAPGHGGGAVDAVFQLADVAGELAGGQDVHGAVGEMQIALVFLVEALEEGVGEQRDVVAAVAQRRHEDRHDVDNRFEH